jgi:hypothetical protein
MINSCIMTMEGPSYLIRLYVSSEQKGRFVSGNPWKAQFTHPARDYKIPKAVISNIHDRMSSVSNYKQLKWLFSRWIVKSYFTPLFSRPAQQFFGNAKVLQHFCNGQYSRNRFRFSHDVCDLFYDRLRPLTSQYIITPYYLIIWCDSVGPAADKKNSPIQSKSAMVVP